MKKPVINPSWITNNIESSQIKQVALDKLKSVLYIVFSNGSMYSYSPFTEEEYNKFVNAPSAGSYFHKKIKNNKNIICKKT